MAWDVRYRTVGSDDRLAMLSARRTLAHPWLCRCAPHRRRWRWPRRRSIDGNQSTPVSRRAEERRRIDVPVALAKAEVEPFGGRADEVARLQRGADIDLRRGQASVGGRPAVALFDHHETNAGDDSVEPDRTVGGRHHRCTGLGSVLQSSVPRAERARRGPKGLDDRRRNRRPIARWGEQGERHGQADHGLAPTVR